MSAMLCRNMPKSTDTPWYGRWWDTASAAKCTKILRYPITGASGGGSLLKAGMVICIEPMINMGKRDIVFERDGWTVRTRDRKPAAHFEFAVAITENGPDVLTDFGIIEKAINN